MSLLLLNQASFTVAIKSSSRFIVRFRSRIRLLNLGWVIRCRQLVLASSSNSLAHGIFRDFANSLGSVFGGLVIGNLSECATKRIAESKLGYRRFF